MQKYFGGFRSREDILHEFTDGTYDLKPKRSDVPPARDILFAAYEGAAYEGAAFVIFRCDGKLYEVHGSHCSCYGLEGQWYEEETTVEALAMRRLPDYDYAPETIAAFARLVENLRAQEAS